MNLLTFAIGFVVILVLAIIGILTTTIATIGTTIYEYFFIVIFLYLIIHFIIMCHPEHGPKRAFLSALRFSPIIECLCFLSYLCSVMENNLGDMIILIIMFIITFVKYFVYLLITVHLARENSKPAETVLQITFFIGRVIFLLLFVNSGITL